MCICALELGSEPLTVGSAGPIQVEHTITGSIHRFWFENPQVGRPINEDALGPGLKELYPSFCREAVRTQPPLAPSPNHLPHVPWSFAECRCNKEQALPSPHLPLAENTYRLENTAEDPLFTLLNFPDSHKLWRLSAFLAAALGLGLLALAWGCEVEGAGACACMEA